MKLKVLAGVLAVAVVAGGAFALSRFYAGAADDAITIVPRHSVVYVNVFLSPSTSQKRALESLLAKFEAVRTPEKAEDELVALIDEALRDAGLTFERDVEPWLGHQVALYVGKFDQLVPEVATLIATEDEDATRRMIAKLNERFGASPQDATYEGVRYQVYPDEQIASGFVSGFWVLGSESGFKAVVDAERSGESLAGSEAFEGVVDRVAEDRVALFYADLGTFFEAAMRFAGAQGMTADERAAFESLGLEEAGPAVSALSLRDDAVVLESASTGLSGVFAAYGGAESLGGDFVSDLPGGSWIALGAGDLGAGLEGLLDLVESFAPPGAQPDLPERQFTAATGLDFRDNVLSWMGDAGLFVQGRGFLDLGGGLVLETTDPASSRKALDALAAFAIRNNLDVVPHEFGDGVGYGLQQRGMPEPVYAMAADDKVVVAYGRKATEDALGSGERLAGSETFGRARAALGDDFAPAMFFDADAIVSLVENMGANTDQNYRDRVAPWVRPLTHVIAGSKLDGDVVMQRVVIGAE